MHKEQFFLDYYIDLTVSIHNSYGVNEVCGSLVLFNCKLIKYE